MPPGLPPTCSQHTQEQERHLSNDTMEVDGGGLLCVHADDVAASLDEVVCSTGSVRPGQLSNLLHGAAR